MVLILDCEGITQRSSIVVEQHHLKRPMGEAQHQSLLRGKLKTRKVLRMENLNIEKKTDENGRSAIYVKLPDGRSFGAKVLRTSDGLEKASKIVASWICDCGFQITPEFIISKLN
jgi:hypothetical protein